MYATYFQYLFCPFTMTQIPAERTDNSLHKSQANSPAETNGKYNDSLLDVAKQVDGAHQDLKSPIHLPAVDVLRGRNDGNVVIHGECVVAAPANTCAGHGADGVGCNESGQAMTPRSAEDAAASKRRSISSRGPSDPPRWSPQSKGE
jgi:hypothetical protein